jgi:hypothetical protein
MYGGNFIIIFSNDPIRTGKIVKADPTEIKNMYALTFHNFLYNKWESFAICLNFWERIPITIGTLIHEITHVGNRIMAARDFIPNFTNDEADAYLKAWLGDEIEKFMKKCNII